MHRFDWWPEQRRRNVVARWRQKSWRLQTPLVVDEVFFFFLPEVTPEGCISENLALYPSVGFEPQTDGLSRDKATRKD